MADVEEDFSYMPPVYTRRLPLPQEHELLLTYNVYKPSPETLRLSSEKGRNVFGEAVMEQSNLGPLSDLCLRAWSKAYGPAEPPMVRGDPVKQRIHYDALSVDLPLEECYHINSDRYWRRVVLQKSTDKSLSFLKEYNWKNHAISMKFVELVEACPAEYWPEEEIKTLATKIKEFVTEMHIRKLQSLQEHSFKQYFEPDKESLGSTDSTDISSVSLTDVSVVEDEEQGEEEEIPEKELDENEQEEKKEPVVKNPKTEFELQVERMEALIRAERRAEQRTEHEQKRKAIEAQQDRRYRREALRKLEEEEVEPVPTTKKKVKKIKVKSVFDIEISEEEDDGEDAKCDKRNLELFLKKMKTYKYPPEHCHHIDLRFVRYFDNLESFSIEFQGPEAQRNYHTRHFNFSHSDIEHLAYGVSFLSKLKIFRLRSSRMDAKKFETMLKSLRTLEALEEVDFGLNQLNDNCGSALFEFFQNTTSVKTLILDGNNFSADVMAKLGMGLAQYSGTLNYLSLADNPLGDEGLHNLVSNIVGTPQVSQLSLTSILVSDKGIYCCVANELLRKHPILKSLNIIAIPMGPTAAREILKALQDNKAILHLDCRGCDMEYDMERDVELILKRNHYIDQNPYVGDPTKSEQEIHDWVNRVKNPILLDVMERVQKTIDCLKERPSIFERISLQEEEASEEQSTRSGSSYMSSSSGSIKFPKGPFIYDTSKFTEEEFLDHVFVPGPGERYFYLRGKPQFDIEDDDDE